MATTKKLISLIAALMIITAFSGTINVSRTDNAKPVNVYLVYEENTRVQQWKHYYDVVQTHTLERKRGREFYYSSILHQLELAGFPKERAEIYAEIPEIESYWRSSAISPRGAKGLWQVMPQTAKRFGFKPDDMFDPPKATKCAIKYIAFLDSLYQGDAAAVLFAYNGGEGAVNSHRKQFQTMNVWNIEFKSREQYTFAPKVLGAWLHNRESY
jgi:membrane-bound lytic murein transglycosylase D